jgi:hypothetical protein
MPESTVLFPAIKIPPPEDPLLSGFPLLSHDMLSKMSTNYMDGGRLDLSRVRERNTAELLENALKSARAGVCSYGVYVCV